MDVIYLYSFPPPLFSSMGIDEIQGVRLAVWNDVPHPLMHLRIQRPYIPLEPRSYPRVYSPLSTYTGPYFNPDPREHWNGKSIFPNLTTTSEQDSKLSQKETDPHHQHAFHTHSPNISGADFDKTTPYQASRKWSIDDVERYFTQMRVTTTTPLTVSKKNNNKDVVVDTYGGQRHQSPATTTTPNDTDESISGESSLGTSSGNNISLNSINGSLGNSNNVPERNRVVLEKIRIRLDMRTTIMIKNVPNKYTQV